MRKNYPIKHRSWLVVLDKKYNGEYYRTKERVFTGTACCGIKIKGSPGAAGSPVTCKNCLKCKTCTNKYRSTKPKPRRK